MLGLEFINIVGLTLCWIVLSVSIEMVNGTMIIRLNTELLSQKKVFKCKNLFF